MNTPIIILIIIISITVAIIWAGCEKAINKITKDNEGLWRKLLIERRKTFELKRQIEYYNIFLKEIKMITEENNYGSVKNIENKLRSAIEDINKADNILHFSRSEK